MNRRFILALAASALFGLIAILVFQQILARRVALAGEQGQTKILCAATKITTGTVIAHNHLKAVPYPTLHIQPGTFNIQSEKDIIGKVAQVDIEVSSPILSRDIATPGDSALKNRLREGYRAMSIRVDEASSVSGFATPGSIVDVGAVINSGTNSKPVSKTLVQNLRVLAMGNQTQARSSEGQQGQRIGNTVTLEVTPAQAEMLALAGREGGALYLTLRHPADENIVPIPPVVMNGIVDNAKTDSAIKTSSTPQPTPQFYGPWYPAPEKPKATPAPAPTTSPAVKMASVRIINGVQQSEVVVRQ